MPAFQSNPLNQSELNRKIRRHPALVGLSFVLLIVGASFALVPFTQTRYDLQQQKVSTVNEEELGLKKRRIDRREEYFRLEAPSSDNWEQKRVERPKGVPEWGVPPAEPPSRENK